MARENTLASQQKHVFFAIDIAFSPQFKSGQGT